MGYCKKCGKEVPEGTTFCQNCGTSVMEGDVAIQANIAPATDVKRCKHCKEMINAKAKACPKCKKRQRKPIWLVVLLAVVIVVLLVIIIGSLGGSAEPKYDSNGNPVYVSTDKIDDIYLDTSTYYGQFVDLSCKVFGETEEEGGQRMIQVWADPENSEKSTVIYYDGDLIFKSDDYVKVTGYVHSVLRYSNAFGADMSAPVVMATKIEKASYADAVAPALKTQTYENKSINQKGYIIKVDKVEFAKNETRVFVTATNNAKETFSIYTYSAIITQNGKQYEQQDNWDADYEELQSELKPGITSSGVLVFPAINQSGFKLIMGGSSDDWDVDIGDYSFTLDVM